MGNVAKWKTIGKFIIKSDFLILLIRAREGVFLLISCCGGRGGEWRHLPPTPLTHKHKLSLLPYRAVNTLPETYSKRNPIVILHNVYMDQNQSCLADWYGVPTTGSLMGTRWKEAPLDNPMQLARGTVDTKMCSHLVGHWVQGICCARAYMHVVSNQMRERSCTEIFYMQFNCRCTHAMVLQKHTFNGQLVAVFSS